MPNLIQELYPMEHPILSRHPVKIEYVDHTAPKDTILNTNPKSDQMIYPGQTILLELSSGEITKYYKNLEQQLYDMIVPYLEELTRKHSVHVVVEYVEKDDVPNGFILTQSLKRVKIETGQTLKLVVVENTNVILLPNFVNESVKEALEFSQNHQVNFEYIYIDSFEPHDTILSQSISPGTEIMKRGNPIVLYISKGFANLPNIDTDDLDEILSFCKENQIEFEIYFIRSNAKSGTIKEYYYSMVEEHLRMVIIVIQ